MKLPLSTVALLALGTTGTVAFTSPSLSPQLTRGSSLAAKKNDWMGAATAAALGLTLASQVAVASPTFDNSLLQQQPQQPSSSVLLSVEKLDFSLPSYDAIGANEGGFGVGTEAKLGQDPGSFEKAKQEDAMRKAEEARLARKAAEKEAKLQRNEDQLRAAEAKKKADQQRIAELFGK